MAPVPSVRHVGLRAASWQVIPFGGWILGIPGPIGTSSPTTTTLPGSRPLAATFWRLWPAACRRSRPPHFRPLFGDAAIYAEPAEVPSVLSQLYADRQAYEDVAARAWLPVRAGFGYEAHQRRFQSSSDGRKQLDSSKPIASSPKRATSQRPSLLLISSNGAGMGHLTRLMAYARRAEPEMATHFVSLSQAVGVVAQVRVLIRIRSIGRGNWTAASTLEQPFHRARV